MLERLLFGETLADKLVEVRSLPAGRRRLDRVPEAPGRPVELRFAPAGEHSPLPTEAALRAGRGRGELLHAFANHELLAIELMALFLLRHPELPEPFVQAQLRVLRDEQRHLRGYLEVMERYGVKLGEQPLSRFFWTTLAPVDDPRAFLAGMALTFEQANLDHATTWAARFREWGDEGAALHLDRVLHDEIRHVAHGWRVLNEPAPLGWDEWVGLLPRPLQPVRARGPVMNVEARRRAGLPEAWIEAVARAEGSKGRRPTVWFFLPDGEAEVGEWAEGGGVEGGAAERGAAEGGAVEGGAAEGGAVEGGSAGTAARVPRAPGSAPQRAQPPARPRDDRPAVARAVARDLGLLLAFVAKPGDVVLVERLPGEAWRRAQAGRPMPELRAWTPGEAVRLPFPPSGAEGWGWTPRSCALLGSVGAPAWRAEWAGAWSKAFGAALGRQLPAHPLLCPPEDHGELVREPAALGPLLAAMAARGHGRVVLKAPFATAGRGNLVFPVAELAQAAAAGRLPPRVEVALLRGGLVVEPWLDRLADLSVQLDVGADALRVHPWMPFFAGPSGQYLGAWLGPPLRAWERGLVRIVTEDGRDPGRLSRQLGAAAERVGAALRERGLLGPAGIDALLYRDPAGAVRLKAVVEVNPRLTMGRVALALRRRVHSRRDARLRLVGREEAKREGFPDLAAWAAARPAPVWVGAEGGGEGALLDGGTWVLTDAAAAERVVAVVEVMAGVG